MCHRVMSTGMLSGLPRYFGLGWELASWFQWYLANIANYQFIYGSMRCYSCCCGLFDCRDFPFQRGIVANRNGGYHAMRRN
jgi:hypothetical protein